MLDLAWPKTSPQTIEEHLRHGGATDLRTATDRVWVVGCAPSGVLFELFWWPGHGYSVTRRSPVDQPGQQLGIYPLWTVAANRALHA
jgi:hypothetical protein